MILRFAALANKITIMAMTIKELVEVVTQVGGSGSCLPHPDFQEACLAAMPTVDYTDASGRNTLLLELILINSEKSENDTKLVIRCHDFILVEDTTHLRQLLVACAFLQSYPQSVVQFQFLAPGIVSASIELPLGDNKVTAGQLRCCFQDLASTADRTQEPLKDILATGTFAKLKSRIPNLPEPLAQWLDQYETAAMTERL